MKGDAMYRRRGYSRRRRSFGGRRRMRIGFRM